MEVEIKLPRKRQPRKVQVSKSDFSRDSDQAKNWWISKVPGPVRPWLFRGIIAVLFFSTLFGFYQKIKSFFPDRSSGLTTMVSEHAVPRSPATKGAVDELVDSRCDGIQLLDDAGELDGFDTVSRDPLTISLKSGSPGQVAFFGKPFGSSFSLSLSVLPMKGRIPNIVFQYDSFFRTILGEEDDRGFSLEKNGAYPAVPGKWEKQPDEERGLKKRYIGGDGFRLNSPVTVDILSKPEDGLLAVEESVTYYPKQNQLGGAPQVARYKYRIPVGINAEGLQGRLGIGLIESSDIQLQILNACLEKY